MNRPPASAHNASEVSAFTKGRTMRVAYWASWVMGAWMTAGVGARAFASAPTAATAGLTAATWSVAVPRPLCSAKPSSVHAHLAQEDSYGAPPDAADAPTAYPAMPPPDPIPEYAPPSPGYGYMWVNGYWDWTGYDWTWYSGFWVPRRAGTTFYAPQYAFVNGELVYYRPYWADAYGRREYGYGWRGAPPVAWRARPSVAPTAWRSGHNEGWRRSPGAPTVWRGSARHEMAGGRPMAGGTPRMGYSKEKQPKMEERAGFEAGHAAPHEQPAPAGGWHAGAPGHSEAPAASASRTPMGPAAHAVSASPPAAHPAPAPRPAAPPVAHNAPANRKK